MPLKVIDRNVGFIQQYPTFRRYDASSTKEMDVGEYKGLDIDQATQLLSRQETLLKLIYSKLLLVEIAEEQLALLRRLQRQTASQSTETQIFWNMFLQVAGMIFAILFGIFVAFSYIISKVANGKTSDANKLEFFLFALQVPL